MHENLIRATTKKETNEEIKEFHIRLAMLFSLSLSLSLSRAPEVREIARRKPVARIDFIKVNHLMSFSSFAHFCGRGISNFVSGSL